LQKITAVAFQMGGCSVMHNSKQYFNKWRSNLQMI